MAKIQRLRWNTYCGDYWDTKVWRLLEIEMEECHIINNNNNKIIFWNEQDFHKKELEQH